MKRHLPLQADRGFASTLDRGSAVLAAAVRGWVGPPVAAPAPPTPRRGKRAWLRDAAAAHAPPPVLSTGHRRRRPLPATAPARRSTPPPSLPLQAVTHLTMAAQLTPEEAALAAELPPSQWAAASDYVEAWWVLGGGAAAPPAGPLGAAPAAVQVLPVFGPLM